MTLTRHPGSACQLAVISPGAGHARDIMLMLADAAARQAAASLDDAGSLCTLPALAAALTEVTSWLHHARRDATAHIPPGF